MSEAAMYLLELSLVFAVGKFVNFVLLSRIVVAGGVVVRVLDLRLKR